jgi:hypothetical protein
MTGIGLRIALISTCLHLGGTFLTCMMVPTLIFQADNPLLLTIDVSSW